MEKRSKEDKKDEGRKAEAEDNTMRKNLNSNTSVYLVFL